eukprot:TRINITY_DN593_c0_g1_i2.p1 TRINITY_DN593_c0_g1~~TRINITY_DN593_c0_g1_i2.p1  ORF type:complete len:329 (+),score=59.78 TRINITY_DN593_c0_g1_i2:109-1095(+)
MTEPARKRAKYHHHYDTRYLSKRKRKTFEISNDDNFILTLAKTKVDDIQTKRAIVYVNTEDTLPEAFTKMNSKNLLSLPVLKEGTEYFGFIDILDIVTWVVDTLGERVLVQREIEEIINDFKTTRVIEVMQTPYDRRNPFHPINTGSSLLTAIEILATGIHRVPIIDGKELVNIVTQSAVVKWVKKNIGSLGKQNLKVSDLDCYQYVINVYDTQKAFDAFRLIRLSRVGAVAIIDDEGKLVGNLSARDMKRIAGDAKYFTRLFENVKTFRDGRRIPHVSVTEDKTLFEVLELLEKHNIHRVYVVDEEHHPIGVISLTDILAALLPGKP